MNPLITVIVATFNRSRVLRLAVSSVLAQDEQRFEVLVIGDACTDDSEAVVASFGDPRLHWHNLPQNSGTQSGPNNEGVRRARGRYVAFLGHDDLWFPWHLSSLLAAMTEETALAHGIIVCLDPKGPRATVGRPRRGEYRGHFIPPSCWLLRKEWADKVGPWKAAGSLPHPVDFDILQRLVGHGASFGGVSRLTVLKYTSAWFQGAYANNGVPPQEAAWAAMQADPAALEHSILTQVAAVHALGIPEPALSQQFRALYRLFWKRLQVRWGLNRWPVSAIVFARFQRGRQRMRAFRGLRRD